MTGAISEDESAVSGDREPPAAHGATLPARQRQRALLDIARIDGQVDVTASSKRLNVAPETIRRDLRVLEEHGLVRRSYGLAYPVESAGFESDLARREVEHLAEKRRIAAEAVQHIEDAETIFIDEGYLPLLLAQELPRDVAFTVITASLPIATLLAQHSVSTVILLGGRVRGRTLATVEHWATRMLSEFVIDLAFVGSNGISRAHGLTTPDPVVAEVKRAAVASSRRRVFVGAHPKFAATSFCKFAEVHDMHLIITDTKLPASEAARIGHVGPAVLRV